MWFGLIDIHELAKRIPISPGSWAVDEGPFPGLPVVLARLLCPLKIAQMLPEEFFKPLSKWNRSFIIELWVFWPLEMSTQKPMSPWKILTAFSLLGDPDVYLIQLKMCSLSSVTQQLRRNTRAESNVLGGRGCCSCMGQQPRRLLFLGIG